MVRTFVLMRVGARLDARPEPPCVHRRLRAQPRAPGQQHGAGARRPDHRATDADRHRADRALRRCRGCRSTCSSSSRSRRNWADSDCAAGAAGGPGGRSTSAVQAASCDEAQKFSLQSNNMAHQQPAQRRGHRGDGHAAADPRPLVRPARAVRSSLQAQASDRAVVLQGCHQFVRMTVQSLVLGYGALLDARRQHDRRHDDRRVDPGRPRAGTGRAADRPTGSSSSLAAPPTAGCANCSRVHPAAAAGMTLPAPRGRLTVEGRARGGARHAARRS